MRFDLVTIFPEYFQVLDLSLLGRARQQGLVQVEVYQLRDWAEGKHRSVDDAPAGGGAGMVMRPDVWGRALDQLLAEPVAAPEAAPVAGPVAESATGPRRVLAIPSPAGEPLTQARLEDLTGADQVIVACGRYEGPDARIAEHYRSIGVEVLELSLGDYVLNGGEVAALALVEGVGRLLDGVVGNPDSLVEESHAGAGLLEYPVYTQPRQWRGLEIPPVLASGNHAQIDRWRREQSLRRTAERRPELLSPEGLSTPDLEVVARAGYLLVPRRARVHLRPATGEDVPALVALARRTFPDACPPEVSAEDIAHFIDEEFTPARFTAHLANPDASVWVGEVEGELVAYTLCFRQAPADLRAAPPGAAYVSKCYADPSVRGSGLTGALLDEAVADLRARWGVDSVVLATHIGNRRASKFYRRHGFKKRGRRHFLVGQTDNIDDVFVLDLTRA